MEPVTTVAITTVVGYLAKKLKDNKSIQGFFDDFIEATINTIKPIFIKEDGTPEKFAKDLQEKPESTARQDAVKSALAVAIEDNPQIAVQLQKLAALIEDKKDKGETISIVGSKNVNTGNISAGGNVTFGDNNTYDRNHSSGENDPSTLRSEDDYGHKLK